MEVSMEKIEPMKPVKLISVASSLEADMVVELLNDNKIASIKKQMGSGSYMNLYYGFSVYGAEIYVDEQDFEKASEIIKQINLGDATADLNNAEDLKESNDDSQQIDEEETGESEDQSVDDAIYKGYPFYRNPRIIARIIIGSFIGSSILIYLVGEFVM